MTQQIARLAQENNTLSQEATSLKEQHALTNTAKHEVELELVKQQARADVLERELSRLREDYTHQGDKLTKWVARATQAESTVEISSTGTE